MNATLYNENDQKTAAWLRELVKQGHLPDGDVDTRSIEDLEPDDCRPTSHFFAGIGGWPLALELAGWTSDDVWTGSCPCQPFSAAGKQGGVEDERHLWPAWFRLIGELRPRTIFGEQVAGAVGFGWLDGVFADLEAEGYRCGAVVLGAHSVGAPHIRQRLFWVADASDNHGRRGERGAETGTRAHRERGRGLAGGGATGRLGDPHEPGSQGRGVLPERTGERAAGETGLGVGNADSGRLKERGESLHTGQQGGSGALAHGSGPWGHGERSLIPCGDGKARRVEPSIQPLAHGIPARVVRLRGYGNAIVPQVAAEFVAAFMDTRG